MNIILELIALLGLPTKTAKVKDTVGAVKTFKLYNRWRLSNHYSCNFCTRLYLIYNLEGKHMSSFTSKDLTTPNQMNVSQFSAGIYLIKVTDSQTQLSAKMIKK